MRMAIYRSLEETFNRFLGCGTGHQLPRYQPPGGAQELQVNQGGSVAVGFPPETLSDRAFGSLVKQSADPRPGVGYQQLRPAVTG